MRLIRIQTSYTTHEPVRPSVRAGRWAAAIFFVSSVSATPASAQIVEVAGVRALGMAGAFVAVANDSSATWWNPAGLAEGPFLDMALARTINEASERVPARRDRVVGFTMATPPVGFSFYRLRLTQIAGSGSTADLPANREDERAGTVRSLAVTQFGATFIQTLSPGIHAATTLKYVRGTARIGMAAALTFDVGERLDEGDDLAGGGSEGRFDVDAGVLAVAGPFRLGVTGRNLGAPKFGEIEMPRQVRAGVAFDASRRTGVPLVVAVDVDVRKYQTATGDRRVVAAGAERWFRERRLGIRAGARINSVGGGDPVATVGASWAVRPGAYADGYVARGGDAAERGWGVAMRVSF